MPKNESIVDETVDTPLVVLPVARPVGELVQVTVTKFGAGLVSTGQRDEMGDIFAQRGDKIMVAKSVAQSLEGRGFAETE